MSELRERLEAKSQRFELPRDALARMHERGSSVRRRRRIAASVLGAAIGIAGTLLVVSTFRDIDRTTPAVTPSLETPATLPTIPEGVYWTRPLTRAEVLATMTSAGFSRREADRFYFDHLSVPFDGTIRMGLVIQEGFWFQTARTDTGEQEAGWSGSYEVTGPHTVRATAMGASSRTASRSRIGPSRWTCSARRATTPSAELGT